PVGPRPPQALPGDLQGPPSQRTSWPTCLSYWPSAPWGTPCPTTKIRPSFTAPPQSTRPRYIGEGYSQALEAMEESMTTVYSQISAQRLLPFPSAGQLAAVKAQGGEEVVRAQVCEVMTDKVKVYYVEHGFSEVLSRTTLLELQKDFLKLPFQAATCTLAVNQVQLPFPPVSSECCNYDVSTEKDSLERWSTVTYTNVSVTDVCSDESVFCQLPSRGRVKLNEILEKIEVTSESLVSTPFCGKCCLALYKGRWSRVEPMEAPRLPRTPEGRPPYPQFPRHRGRQHGGSAYPRQPSLQPYLSPPRPPALWMVPGTRQKCSPPTLVTCAWGEKQLALPPLMEIPQAGQNMDIYVSVACHPGHFVLQPWQDLYKLMVLMGATVLCYNQREEIPGPGDVQKGQVYAAERRSPWWPMWSVVEAELPWDRKCTAFDQGPFQKRDIWVHNVMADFPEELSTAP
ncbi:tudor domain-containing protein 7B-like, partial [Salmo trutta]|uniref:tudor domain-containing protein 7B-like n=1 Tax=Salmo trutta TaxID=8032 RepID=UPI00113137E0